MREEEISFLGYKLKMIITEYMPENTILFLRPEDAEKLKQEIQIFEAREQAFERLKNLGKVGMKP